MNAIELLRAGHERVQALFQRFEQIAGGSSAEKGEIIEEACRELLTHAMLEEEIFYARFQELGGQEERSLVDRAIQEHSMMEALLVDVRAMDAADPACDEKFRCLIQDADTHIMDEEEEIFPLARETLAGHLDHLGDTMERCKEQLEAAGVFEERQRTRRAEVTGG